MTREEKDYIQEIIDITWSDLCDLGYWIEEMNRQEQRIPKWVLKMAVKHLKTDLRKIHDLACTIKSRDAKQEADDLVQRCINQIKRVGKVQWWGIKFYREPTVFKKYIEEG